MTRGTAVVVPRVLRLTGRSYVAGSPVPNTSRPGYVAWLLCFGVYVLPRLKSMDRVDALRAIATLHSFRFFGLVFILPGVVGPGLPAEFAVFAAYWDLATAVLAMLALLTVRIRPLFGYSSSVSMSWGRST